MNKLPPSVKHGLHYDDIIPLDLHQTFVNHYLCTYKTESADEFEKALAKNNIKPETRAVIAKIYEELRLNGWHPVGVESDEYGAYNIKWAYRVSRESPPDNLPVKMSPAESKAKLSDILEKIACGETTLPIKS